MAPHTLRTPRAPLLAVALLCMLPHRAVADGGGWLDGRATFYDDNTQGSCRFGNQIPEMYAAWPDTLAGFEGSCGTCLEVACVNKDFTDSFGSWQQRSNACYDEDRTVVVKIVDSCPCVHANYHSNQRWCCGDMKHIDLGRAAFQQLAPEQYGVIGLKWRQVDCSGLGAAPQPADTTPAPATADQQQGLWQQPQLPAQGGGGDGDGDVGGISSGSGDNDSGAQQWAQSPSGLNAGAGVQQKVAEWKGRVSSGMGGVLGSWLGRFNG